VQTIVLAAQAESAPAIIQVSHQALAHIGNGNEIQGLQSDCLTHLVFECSE